MRAKFYCIKLLFILYVFGVGGVSRGESLKPYTVAGPAVIQLVRVGPLSERAWVAVMYGALARSGSFGVAINCVRFALQHPVQRDIEDELIVVYDRYLNSIETQALLEKFNGLNHKKISDEEYVDELRMELAKVKEGGAVGALGFSGLGRHVVVGGDDSVLTRFDEVNLLAKMSVGLLLKDKVNRAAGDVLKCEAKEN